MTLARLLAHRRLGARELAVRTGTAVAAVRDVLTGTTPASPALLRRLGPVLGWEPLDLFILAGLPVPEDLTPLDAEAGRPTARIVMDGMHLPPAVRQELLRHMRALPQRERRSPFTPKHLELAHPEEPGGQLIRMFLYRNLSWQDLAHVMYVVTPSYLSASTYGMVGAGRAHLTPRLVTDFATLLGHDPTELAAVTDVPLPTAPFSPPPPATPAAHDAVALLREARRLSALQADQVAGLARSLRAEPRDVNLADLSHQDPGA
ncbi:hypothetical protein [Streptomyces sp. NPDC051561]|uniref:hypothetical protein n=1 Tax=Streptomyces sp. NPDC051561 TaxID=3365658 RepID=UPI0037ABA2AF